MTGASCLWLIKCSMDIMKLKCIFTKNHFICLLKTSNFYEHFFYSLAMRLYVLPRNTFSMDKEQCLFFLYGYDPNRF